MHIIRLRDLSQLLHKLEIQRHHARTLGLPLEASCHGFAANAVQIAGASLHFQTQGFRVERVGCPCRLLPTYGDLRGSEAIESFFEIDSFTAQLFFDPDTYDESQITSPGSVAERIDRWIGAAPEAAPLDEYASAPRGEALECSAVSHTPVAPADISKKAALRYK